MVILSRKRIANNRRKVNHNDVSRIPDPNSRTVYSILAAVVVVVIVVTTVVYINSIEKSNSSVPAFNPPKSIPADTVVKVSQTDYSESNYTASIYFISWIGSPSGSADSWVIYDSLAKYITWPSSYYMEHYSDPNLLVPCKSLAGLIFTESFYFKYSGKKIFFQPLYLYNNTLYAYAFNNTLIVPTSLMKDGEAMINSSLPANIASVVLKYTTLVPITNHTEPSSYMASPPHITTIIVLTGPAGTYILNGHFFTPSDIYGSSYSQIFDSYPGFSNYPYIPSCGSYLNLYIGKMF